jgi:DNA polymerase III alpha subunit
MPDIDLDFFDRDNVLTKFKHIKGSRNEKDQLKKHNTGVYFHKVADERGYFKIDMLNVHIYEHVKNEEHLQRLMGKEPLWELLEHEDFSERVFHLNGHNDLLKVLKPNSVEKLAATLAIIRPAKRHLANKDWQTIMNEVWTKPTGDEYYFKKAHAVAYAHAIVVHMNLICEELYE